MYDFFMIIFPVQNKNIFDSLKVLYMKFIKFLSILFFMIGVIGCDQKDHEPTGTMDVSEYIALLRSDQYVRNSLPAFSSLDIPALLEYRNDDHIVTRFPHNPISSFIYFDPEYKLGVLVLWTVESIRVTSVKSTETGRFPSQNPFLAYRNKPSEWILDYNNPAYDIISQTYFDWWNKNKDKSPVELKSIDPLADTNYVWH